jgi:hypothetical protein
MFVFIFSGAVLFLTYADEKLQINELPHFYQYEDDYYDSAGSTGRAEGFGYIHASVDPLNPFILTGLLVGVEQPGLFIRPVAGLEFPIADNTLIIGLPLNFIIGAELPLKMGFVRLIPRALFVVGLSFPADVGDETDDDSEVSHLGVKFSAVLSFSITEKYSFFIEGGWLGMGAVHELVDNYGGYFAGLGLAAK